MQTVKVGEYAGVVIIGGDYMNKIGYYNDHEADGGKDRGFVQLVTGQEVFVSCSQMRPMTDEEWERNKDKFDLSEVSE